MPSQVNPNNGALFLTVLPEHEDIGIEGFLFDYVNVPTDPDIYPRVETLDTINALNDAFSNDEPIFLVRVLKKRYRYYDVDNTDMEEIARHPNEYSCLTVIKEDHGYSYCIRLADYAYVGYYRAIDGTREYTLNLFDVSGHGKGTRVAITGKQAIKILKNARFGRELTNNHEKRYENLVDVALDKSNPSNLAYIPLGSIADETLSSDYDHVHSSIVTEAMNHVAVAFMTEHRFMMHTHEYADMLIEPVNDIPHIAERYDRMLAYLTKVISHEMERAGWNPETVSDIYADAKHAANINTGYSPPYVFVVATKALVEWVSKTRAPVDLAPCGEIFIMSPETETLAIASLEERLIYR